MDGADYNIPFAFLKKHGEKNVLQNQMGLCNFCPRQTGPTAQVLQNSYYLRL